MYLKWGKVGGKAQTDPWNLNFHPHTQLQIHVDPSVSSYMFTLAPNFSMFSSPLVTSVMDRVE